MFCSKCGSPNPEGSAFCSTCGQQLSATGAQSAPQAATPPQGAYGSVPAPGAGTPAGTAAPAGQAGVSPHWRPAPATLYAGFWLRVVAHIVDSLILGVPFGIAFVLFLTFGGLGAAIHGVEEGGQPSPEFVAFIVVFAVIFSGVAIVGSWLYYAYFESSTWQGTPGKKILNVFVTDMNGNPVTFGRASGRYFAKIITGLIPLGIGYILAGITEKKQALHDMIANCLVLRRY